MDVDRKLMTSSVRGFGAPLKFLLLLSLCVRRCEESSRTYAGGGKGMFRDPLSAGRKELPVWLVPAVSQEDGRR